MKEVHKKSISIEMPELEKYQEIVEIIINTAATKETEAPEKRQDAKAQAERENAAAAQANRTLEEAEAQEIERRSMKSSSTDTNRRSVSALSEHRRQDGWTSTPYSCGGSSDSSGYDEKAGERLPKQRPHLIEGTKDEEEACVTTAKKDEEPPDRNTAEHLGARHLHPDEEAGSIVFHFSSNMSETRKYNNEARATACAAAQVIEDLSIKDAEILRLIEERRNTPKGESTN